MGTYWKLQRSRSPTFIRTVVLPGVAVPLSALAQPGEGAGAVRSVARVVVEATAGLDVVVGRAVVDEALVAVVSDELQALASTTMATTPKPANDVRAPRRDERFGCDGARRDMRFSSGSTGASQL